jgi:hypothetical protein
MFIRRRAGLSYVTRTYNVQTVQVVDLLANPRGRVRRRVSIGPYIVDPLPIMDWYADP